MEKQELEQHTAEEKGYAKRLGKKVQAMTDNEIIKALECCAVMYDCPDCPFECDCGNMGNLSTAAIDLINRLNERDKKNERIIELSDKTIKTQSAEIERYLHSIKLLEKDVQTAKSEAIKEFAERYEKAVLPLLTSATLDKKDGIHACLDILKEMVGDDNA